MIISLVGDEKTGKTTFTLTAPQIISHYDFDVGGFDRASWRFREGIDNKQIRSQRIYIPHQVDSISLQELRARIAHFDGNSAAQVQVKPAIKLVGVKEAWYTFVANYIKDLENSEIKTIVLDSGTLMWPLCHGALLQEKQEAAISKGREPRERLQEIEYGEANARMNPIFWAARENNKNLILIHHTDDARQDYMDKDGQVKSRIVGQKPGGWKSVRKLIDLELWFRLVDNPNGSAPIKIPQAEVTITGISLDLLGLKLNMPTWGDVDKYIKMLRGDMV